MWGIIKIQTPCLLCLRSQNSFYCCCGEIFNFSCRLTIVVHFLATNEVLEGAVGVRYSSRVALLSLRWLHQCFWCLGLLVISVAENGDWFLWLIERLQLVKEALHLGFLVRGGCGR